MKEKSLVIIRHAHRDTSDRARDNGLSLRGKSQVRALLRYYRANLGQARGLILSSPKKRCLQTASPILGQLVIDPRLLEQGEWETRAKFRERIRLFSKWWLKQKEPLVVACSHGDFIPELVRELTGARIEIAKGGWVEIAMTGKQAPVLKTLLQNPASGGGRA